MGYYLIMVIKAKFSTVCPCCANRIDVGAKVEWTKGERAVHVACAAKPISLTDVAAAMTQPSKPSAAAQRYARSYSPRSQSYSEAQRRYDLDLDC